MKKIPKVKPIRPDFMAPGPKIKIVNKEGLMLDQSDPLQDDEDEYDNEEEDFTPYKYYTSDKVLGKLFRAVDEHDIFSELHKYRMTSRENTNLLDELWHHVSRRTVMIQWHQHILEAQDLRDM